MKDYLKNNVIVRRGYGALKSTANVARSVLNRGLHVYPAGHYYSPLPDAPGVDAAVRAGEASPASIAGVNLREDEQMALLDVLAEFHDEAPFTDQPSPGVRYFYDNIWFAPGDAIVLYALLRHLQPRRVVEVGSGFSSAVMLDTNERFLGGKTEFTFIDPFPERLYGLMSPDDRREHRVIVSPVQGVDKGVFEALESGDILFIDSSHVLKAGSDVSHLLFDVLPRLAEGVVVHIHDVLWPFEYPATWLREGRAWNEAYAVRAFLQYNAAFEIVYFNSFVGARHGESLAQRLPVAVRNSGGSIWLRKRAQGGPSGV